jgi:outer membrane receptor protein involved in Fe transport
MGVVVTPSFVRGFNVSLDYYQITLNNAIGTLGATNTQIAQLCEDSKGAADVCSLWLRPLPFSDHSSANYPTRIFTKGLNAAYQKIQGWDFEANYHFGLASLVGGAPGDIALRFLANYQPTQETIQFVGAAKTVTPNPKTRITATMSYRDGPWRVSLTDRWLDSYAKASLATQVYLDPTVPSFNQVDIQIARDFKIMHADMNAFVQVENIFDPPPPLYTTLTSNPGFNYPVPNSYPIFGRYITVGLRAKF